MQGDFVFIETAMGKRFKKIYVEISNVCNVQCSFCPVVDRDKKVMGPELFKKTLTQIAPLTDEVCFHLMGEPLTHHLLDDYVDLCAKASLPINLTTNGMLIDDEKSKTLLKNSVRQVNFSFQSYESNFGLNGLEAYLDKIFIFTERAFEIRPDLYINYRLWNKGDDTSNEGANEIILKAIENHFNVTINRNVDVGFKKSKKIKNRLYLHFDSRFVWPGPQEPNLGTKGTCHGLSSHIGIHAEGTVVPCCLDKEAVINLGNISDNSIESIITSPRSQAMIEGFKKNKLAEDLCQRCDFIRRFS